MCAIILLVIPCCSVHTVERSFLQCMKLNATLTQVLLPMQCALSVERRHATVAPMCATVFTSVKINIITFIAMSLLCLLQRHRGLMQI